MGAGIRASWTIAQRHRTVRSASSSGHASGGKLSSGLRAAWSADVKPNPSSDAGTFPFLRDGFIRFTPFRRVLLILARAAFIVCETHPKTCPSIIIPPRGSRCLANNRLARAFSAHFSARVK